ncbi:hypothetical protein K1719_037946 [Acacia pycnantha]|nr:hypothetical protein K1719_037946 [Acacia pycnantha]
MERQEGQPNERDSVMILQSEKAKESNTLLPSHPASQRNQISYRNKLLEKDEEVFSQELEDQMKEWLCEEKAISSPLPRSENSYGVVTKAKHVDERIAWILRSRNFELIDLPNNYFVFTSGNREMRLKLLFDEKCPLALNLGEDSSGVIEPKKRIEPRESGSKEDVVGHIENEQLNLGMDERCDLVTMEPHLEPPTEIERKEKATKVKEKAGKATKIVETRLEPSTEIERKGTVTEVKEKEGKATDAPVGKPVTLSQATLDYNLRPNGLSSVRNKKKVARDHNVIFGSTKTIESSKVNETKAP